MWRHTNTINLVCYSQSLPQRKGSKAVSRPPLLICVSSIAGMTCMPEGNNPGPRAELVRRRNGDCAVIRTAVAPLPETGLTGRKMNSRAIGGPHPHWPPRVSGCRGPIRLPTSHFARKATSMPIIRLFRMRVNTGIYVIIYKCEQTTGPLTRHVSTAKL